MPDLQPVSGDPFAPQMVPVSGDPFAPRTVPVSGNPFDPAAIASMTHAAPEQVQPYMHPNVPATASAVAGFASGGLQGAGVPLPGWAAHNPVQEALQNPDINAALGMARPWGYWGGEGLTLLRRSVEAGKTQQEIALEHGLDQSTVAQILKKYGLQTANSRGPRPKSDEDIHNLEQMINKGMTWQAIADNLGVKSAGSVRNLAKRYGLTGEQSFGVAPVKSVPAKLSEDVTQTLYGEPAPRPSPKSASPAPNVRLEPVEHNPFSAEDERIFGYREQ